MIVDQPCQPTLVYNARGTATLGLRGPARAPDALGRLLGTNRAALLDALSIPGTTTGLAGRFGWAASTVSAHLTVLKDAGLLTSRRDGYRVRYRRTPLGEALVNST